MAMVRTSEEKSQSRPRYLPTSGQNLAVAV